jgi:hypothetical protein
MSLFVLRAVLTVTREKPPKSFGVAAPPIWLSAPNIVVWAAARIPRVGDL